MTGTGGQLFFLLGAAINAGLSEAQVKNFITVIGSRVLMEAAEGANEILSEIISVSA